MLYTWDETRSIGMRSKQADFSKNERINLRIDRHTKELIEQAAAIDHRSLTSFIIACAKDHAEQLIERETTIRLNKRDWDRFMQVLDNPPKPNAALKKLLRESAPS
jgi:uncharacterized protein (DUF1778 family)